MMRWLLMVLLMCAAAGVEAAPAQREDGYRGIWFTLGQFTEHGDKYSGGLGTYTANHVPIAVYAPKVGKTFFVYGGARKGTRHLLIMAGWYDHKRHRVPRPIVVHDKGGVTDPHDNASIALDPDGHVWVFVSGRGRARMGYKYRSREPYSIDAFERVSEEEMTYPQPWWVPGRGFLHLFTKYTKGRELYWETSPDGRTWSEDAKLAGMGGHYQVSGRHGDKVCTFFNMHPGGSVDKRTNLYYAQTSDFGSTWTAADGTPLQLPLEDEHNPALVFDYRAEGRLMYTLDLAFDRRGNPVLLYITSRGFAPGPAGDPREWTVARWTGKAWERSVVCRSDHNYDLGSLFIEGRRWTVIGPTEPGPQAGHTGGEVAVWASEDEGRSWRKERDVTRDSTFNHTYVRRPQPYADPFAAFWADGDPTRFSGSSLFFCDSTGRKVWRLPETMDGDFAEPEQVPPPSSSPL